MKSSLFPIEDLVCIVPALMIFLASLVPLTLKVLRGNKEPHPTSVVLYGFIGLLAALFASLILYSNQTTAFFAFSEALVFDGLSAFSTIMVSLITGIALLFSREHVSTKGAQFSEYVFLLMNATVGMLILAWSNDLIVTFIGIEVMSLCLYLTIALSNEERLSKEAAFKYFVLGSFASAIFLYGIALIYGATGTTYIHKVLAAAPELIATNYTFLIGTVLMILGFAFKVSLAPFHAWTPDVYEGAPTPVTAFMSTGVKLVSFVAFIRVLVGDYVTKDMTGNLINILQWLAVITMLVGNIGAIVQPGLKRMLAYSSVAHSGFIFMGTVCAAVGGQTWLGTSGVTFYLFAYAIMTIGAFGVVALLEEHDSDLVLVDDLAGLGRRSPVLALCLTIFLVSLAGLPPTIGFFGKFFLFAAAIKQGLFWLAVWAAINSAIAVYYYLRPIVVMYMHEPNRQAVVRAKAGTYAAVTAMAVLVLVFGLTTDPIYRMIVRAVSGLM